MRPAIFLRFWFVLQTILIIGIKSASAQGETRTSQSPRAAQTDTLTGKILTDRGTPIPYASVSLKNSTDATTADSSGVFTLTTNTRGSQTLLISAIGFKETEVPVTIGSSPSLSGRTPSLPGSTPSAPGSLPSAPANPVVIKLKPTASQLNPVVITAGIMEATDDRVLTIVKPVDVMSNASSTGDLVGAFQNFPGVQRNGGDQTGLFVRGGDASETMMILDGTTVQNPFYSSVPGVGQRSRFNSFQIKGMSFSTGGYSARYGQALSSVLDLQSTDLPEKSTLSIGANIAGLMIAGGQRIGNNALEYSGSYSNFGPYYDLAKTNFHFYEKPQAKDLSTRWIARTHAGGLFKLAVHYNHSTSGTDVIDPDDLDTTIAFGVHNDNLAVNTSFKTPLSNSLKLFTAAGFSTNKDDIGWGDTVFNRNDNRLQARTELTWHPGASLRVTAGGEVQHYRYAQQFDPANNKFTETLSAAYVEGEYRPMPRFAIKPGFRTEYSAILQKGNAVPRFALAVKTGPYSQIGVATGMFYQTAGTQYLLLGYRPNFQKAVHYLVNYEWIEASRSFRIEGYYKSYSQLVRENGVPYTPNPYRYDLGNVDNTGSGYARGFDIFWRDKASIRNIDYWVTYSYVDTKRLYQNYPRSATPDFVSTNNLNVIVKYYSDRNHIFASAAYNYASGRPYYDPNAKSFLTQRAPDYQNFSVKVSYLTSIKKMFAAFYMNVDDVTGRRNILGYRYSTDGQTRSPILPPQYMSIFFGVYLSLSQFKKDEL